MRLKATVVLEYDANPTDYEWVTDPDKPDPQKMVELDMKTDIVFLLDRASVCTIKGEEA